MDFLANIPGGEGIDNPDNVRIVRFVNGKLVHIPLNSITQPLVDQIEALQAALAALDVRVTALEP